MYRIRLTSGEEAVYRTADELALAVRSGVLSPKSQVFHKAADRWLPIEVHPDYRAVVTGPQEAVRIPEPASPLPPDPVPARPAAPAVEPIELAQAIEFTGAYEAPGPGPASPEPAAVPEHEYDPSLDPTPVATVARGADRGSRARKLRVMLALAMGVGGICLVGGAGLVAGPRLARWLSSVRIPSTAVQEGMSPFDSMPPLPQVGPAADSAWPSPGLAPGGRPPAWEASRTYPAPSAPLPLKAVPLASAEPTRVSRLPASRNAAPTYVEAYAEARAEMDEGFDYVQFRRMFAPSRFSAPDSIRAARRTVAAAGNIVRVYRGREVMLEQTFRPDDPGGRGSLRESFETSESARALLADVDSLFALLVAQQGRFRYLDGALRFAEPRTAREYSDLRRRIQLCLADWRDSHELSRGATIPRLLQALGNGSPPPVR